MGKNIWGNMRACRSLCSKVNKRFESAQGGGISKDKASVRGYEAKREHMKGWERAVGIWGCV